MATVGQSGGLRRVTVHYASSPTRGAVAEAEVSLDDLDDELLQFVLADLLPGQEGLHQSILEGAHGSNQENHMRGAGSSAPYDYAQPQGYHAAESSTAATASRRNPGTDAQIASDLEYAKQLQQEMEGLSVDDDDDGDDISCVPSPSDSDDGHDHHDEEEEADRQEDGNGGGGGGDDDPDNMTYEQRQALVESVGDEGRGLSDELISYLQPWKYKASGFFSRKTNHDDCPICLSTFRNRETMITLPCMHHYHAACVTKWLRVNKTCPVCKYELFGPC